MSWLSRFRRSSSGDGTVRWWRCGAAALLVALAGVVSPALGAGGSADSQVALPRPVIPTSESIFVFDASGQTQVHGRLLATGDVIDAFDPAGVHCGTLTVTVPGQFSAMPVYRDDGTTPAVDEGADPGDEIGFEINGEAAVVTVGGPVIWTGNGDLKDVVLQAGGGVPPVIPTNESIFVFDASGATRVHGQPLAIGDVIDAFDPAGVRCGTLLVTAPGQFAAMPVYRDDAVTPGVDEGADPGDEIHFAINGEPAMVTAGGPVVWTANGDLKDVVLQVGEGGGPPVIPTNESIFVFDASGATRVHGQPLATGDVIDAFDPQGIRCGTLMVTAPGQFPAMPVYRDDAVTPGVDEGAEPGDQIHFAINGETAVVTAGGPVIWTANGDLKDVVLRVGEGGEPPVIPTNESIFVFDAAGGTRVHGAPLATGDVIDAFDPVGIRCGTLTVAVPGQFPAMPVYRDDAATPGVDEGAEPGDQIHFAINGEPAVVTAGGPVIWTANGDLKDVVLNVGGGEPPVIPTNESIFVFDAAGGTRVRGEPLAVGDVIDAFDPQGIRCGTLTVRIAGQFPAMPVYRDDAATPGVDEGAEPGDQIHFAINGEPAEVTAGGPVVWTANGDLKDVVLTVGEGGGPPVTPTNESIFVFDAAGGTRVHGQPLAVGEVIDAFDPQGVRCGTLTVRIPGQFPAMPVYRDDGATPGVDEGAEPGDEIRFSINGQAARVTRGGPVIWTGNGDLKDIILTVGGNAPPVLETIADTTAMIGLPFSLALLASDADGDVLTLSWEDLPEGAAITGPVVTGEWHQWTLEWTPTAVQLGPHTMTFTVTDPQGAWDARTVTVAVMTVGNRLPVMAPVGPQTVAEGDSLTVRLSAVDADDDPLTWTMANAPPGAQLTDSTFAWRPGFDQAASYDLTFMVTDGHGGFDRETVRLTVTNTNRLPRLAPVIPPPPLTEGDTLTVPLSAADPDHERLTYGFTSVPPATGATLADSIFVWVPGYDQAGSYEVTFTVSDPFGGRDSTVVPVLVLDLPNQPPVLAPVVPPPPVSEGDTLRVRLSATDPDGDRLTYGFASVPPAPGAILTDSTFVWGPGYDQAGSYVFTFSVSDGHGGFDSIDVPVLVVDRNRPPVLAPPGSRTVAEGDSLTVPLSATDPDRDRLTFRMTNGPAGARLADSTFAWRPGFDQAGSYAVILTVTDTLGLSDTDTLRLAVTNTNRRPVLAPPGSRTVAEGDSLTVRLSANDPDHDRLTFRMAQAPAGARLADSTFTWRPAYNQANAYAVAITVSDSLGLSATDSLRLTVTNTNRRPVFTPVPPDTLTEGDSLTVALAATDPDNDPVTYGWLSVPPATGAHLTGNLFAWRTRTGLADTYAVTFIASDGLGGRDTTRTTFWVFPPNDPPVLATIEPDTVAEGDSLTVRLSAFDPDNDRLTYSMANAPAGAHLADSTFAWRPGFSQAGRYVIPFAVNDGRGGADRDTLRLVVTNTNRLPVLAAVATPAPVIEGDSLTVALSATDPDGEPLTYGWFSVPAATGAGLTGSTFGWRPAVGQAGTYNVTFTVADTSGGRDSSEVVPVTVVASTLTRSLTYGAGWGMISLPVAPVNRTLAALFPGAISAFKFASGYQQATILNPAEGYWLNLPGSPPTRTFALTGDPVDSCRIALPVGWSMFGVPLDSCRVSSISQTPANSIVAVFGFSGGYVQVYPSPPGNGVLREGKGYWINLRNAATLTLHRLGGFTGAPKPLAFAPDWRAVGSRLLVQGQGYLQVVDLGVALDGLVELPPAPPAGVVDARVEVGGRPMNAVPGGAQATEYRLSLQGDGLQLGWQIADLEARQWQLVVNGQVHDLAGTDGLSLDKAPGEVWVRYTPRPASYALGRAYPNPFNPSTTVEYRLAADGPVSLRVYDLAGQTVRTLVAGHQVAGRYAVTWDARDDANLPVASGVYLCRFEAGAQSLVQKMVLLK